LNSFIEIENVFLLEVIIKAVQSHLAINVDILSGIKSKVIQYFSQKIDYQTHVHLKDELAKQYRCLQNIENEGIDAYVSAVNQSFAGIDIKATHQSIKVRFEKIVQDQNYLCVLQNFNEKRKNSIIGVSEIHKSLDLGKPIHYIETVIRLCMSNKPASGEIKSAILATILK